MPDAFFADPRLAKLYDVFDDDRSDLDVYAAIVSELSARSVLDVGCGTGVLACMLAARGLEVTGLDPAEASVEIARRKPHSERVRWIVGDATDLPDDVRVDVATMTGNAAQAVATDDDWAATVAGVHAALRPSGMFVFETRDPARQAWLNWTPENGRQRADVPGEGVVETWNELLAVEGELVTFRGHFLFADGTTLTSDSTLRFRDRPTVELSLADAGFIVDEVRDAPDRPGLEFVFLARRREQ